MDSPSPCPGPESSSGADLARLRRERREAKIKAGGSARLGRITTMGGRPAEAASPASSENSLPAKPPLTEDPGEVDISQHFYKPASTPRPSQPYQQPQQQSAMSDEQLRQMMLNFDGPRPGSTAGPQGLPQFPPSNAGASQIPGSDGEDPMMQMLQQMLGGAGDGDGARLPGLGGGGLPPDLLAQMMGQGGSGTNGSGEKSLNEQYAYVWRILHALFAITLGMYIITTTSFTGTKIERERYVEGDVRKHFFWLFATGELVLQSSRFFLEKGRMLGGGGMVAVMAQMLPEPWKSKVAIVLRYSTIYVAVMQDAMVLIFILGCVAWWNI
ncbi:MAG: hypothetical protein M1837_005510 [Sclerophora amabilis]|nr:MAG: hypothetical protein M1837_005510 [Sclerophora amabilis]